MIIVLYFGATALAFLGVLAASLDRYQNHDE